MTDQAHEHPAVRKLAGALALSTDQAIPISTLRAATNLVLAAIPDIDDRDPRQTRTAATLCQYASAIITARYFHHVLPEVASIDVTPQESVDDDFDVSFQANAYDKDGARLVLTRPESDLAVEIVIDRLFQSHHLLMPDLDETFNLDLQGLRADHPEHEDDVDEILGLDQMPVLPAREDLDLARSDGAAALRVIHQSVTSGMPSPIDDGILHVASAETVRRYEATGDNTHLQFGAMINAFVFARAVRSSLPQVDTVDFAVTAAADGTVDFYLLDRDGDLIEDPDTIAAVGRCAWLLFPNPVFWEYVAAAGARFRVPITDSINRLPAPGA